MPDGKKADTTTQEDSLPSRGAKPAPGAMIASAPVPILPVDKRCVGNNLIENGGFERAVGSAPVSWRLDATAPSKVERTQDYCTEGEYSLQVVVPGNRSFEATQQVQNRGHKEYLQRCFVLPKDISGQVKLAVHDKAQNGEIVSAQSEAITGTRKEWTPLQVEFQVPATVNEFAVALQHEAAGEGSDAVGTVWFDQCELYEISAPSRQNLVKNGDFSEGPPNEVSQWTYWQYHTVSRDRGSEIASSLKVESQGAQEVGIMQPIGEVLKPGQRYSLRGYIKTEGIHGPAILQIRDHTGKSREQTPPVDKDGQWTWARTSFTAPADSNDLFLFLVCRAPEDKPPGPCTVWFAHIELSAEKD